MAENKGQQIINCTKCGSNKVKQAWFKGATLLIGFLGIGICMWIPIIGWILIPVFAVVMLAGIVGLFIPTKETTFQCVECKHSFNVDKEKVKEYKEFI